MASASKGAGRGGGVEMGRVEGGEVGVLDCEAVWWKGVWATSCLLYTCMVFVTVSMTTDQPVPVSHCNLLTWLL